MRSPARSTCPICGKQAESPPENAAFPFCSPQCKLVDLGRWLEGSYRFPGPSLDSSDVSEGAEMASDTGDYEEEG